MWAIKICSSGVQGKYSANWATDPEKVMILSLITKWWHFGVDMALGWSIWRLFAPRHRIELENVDSQGWVWPGKGLGHDFKTKENQDGFDWIREDCMLVSEVEQGGALGQVPANGQKDADMKDVAIQWNGRKRHPGFPWFIPHSQLYPLPIRFQQQTM